MYDGLMIGGPADGQRLQLEEPLGVVRFGEQPRLQPTSPGEGQAIPRAFGCKVHEYRLYLKNGHRLTYKYKEQ